MWPFNTQQERQAEAMSMILAENAYERKLERATNQLKTVLALFIGITTTFFILVGLDIWFDISPEAAWNWIRGK
tara:strand:+ start:10337 stop:10558 length:222 start_codon:yes stop_codon:yes gene_type:complete